MLEFLLTLFISPLILAFLLTFPQFIFSYFKKPKLENNFHKLFEKIPSVNILGNGEVLIQNVRDARFFKNENDAKIEWTNKKYSLNNLEKLEILLDNFAPGLTHAIFIFYFKDERELCVSYEIKKKEDLKFSMYKTIYQNIESGYVLGTKEDVIALTKLLRNNDKKIIMLQTNFSKEETQKILMSVLNDVNIYSKKAFFYNFIYRSCMSESFKHLCVSGRFDFTYPELLFPNKLLKRNKVI